MTTIQIDSRETRLINELHILGYPTKDVILSVETLEIGDVIVDNRIIIERKTISDLHSSIMDGRYKEQGYRLSNSAYPNHHIMYLLEGKITALKETDRARIYSAIASLSFYKGFSVMRTDNITETAVFIVSFSKKIHKDPSIPGYYDNPSPCLSGYSDNPSPCLSSSRSSLEPLSMDQVATESCGPIPTQTTHTPVETSSDKAYISVVKSCKKANITPTNIDELMLCQIPGISTQSAIAIMERFGSIREMMRRYSEEGSTVLDGIMLTGKTGKTTRLSRAVVSSIHTFVFKDTCMDKSSDMVHK